MRFPLNMNPRSFTILAFIIGYSLIDDLNANEQNAVGNWLLLIGQVLETNGAQQQIINNQTCNINTCSRDFGPKKELLKIYEQDKLSKDDLNLIKIVIDKIKKEIDELIDKDKG